MADPRDRAVEIPGTDGPSINAPQAVPLEAPHAVAPPARTGLEGLSAAFTSFFGQGAQGMEAVAKAVTTEQAAEIKSNFYLQRAEVEKKNKAKADQATADALAGKPMNDGLTNDYSYATAYQKAAGGQHGVDMQTQWFTDVYSKAKPGDNLMGLTDQWLKQNWANGTGNAEYDAAALTHFKSGVDRAVMQFTENGVKSVMASGLQMQDAAVAQAAKNGRLGEQMSSLSAGYKALDPNNPEKAPLRLAQAIQNSIYSGDPRVAQSTLAALEKPGTGINGKSYAESFPEAYKNVQNQLTEHYLKGGSLQGASAYTELHSRLDDAKNDPIKIAEVGKDLETRVFPQFGGASNYLALKGAVTNQLAQAAKVGVAVNQIGEMVKGAPTGEGRAIDPKVIDAHLQDYFTAKGIDPRQQPEAAGAIVAKLGVAPASLKDDFSQLMLNSNPATQQTAMRYFGAINGTRNDPDAAKPFMNDQAAIVYDAVEHQRAVLGDQALPQILDRVNQNRDAIGKGDKIEWKTITGDSSEGTALANVQTAIKKSVAGTSLLGVGVHTGAFSGASDVTIDWKTERMLEDNVKTAAILSGRRGQADLQTITDQALQNAQAAGKLELVPGEGGVNIVRLKNFKDYDSETGQALIPLSASVPNPATRRPESTLDTFHSDIGVVAKAVPGLIDDPAKISVAPLAPRGVDGQQPEGADGVYWLQRNGNRMTINLGQQLAVNQTGKFDMAVGDSIAVGAIRNGRLGGNAMNVKTDPGALDAEAAGGRNPQEVLDYLQGHTDKLRGKTLFLSSGLMNATVAGADAALPTVQKQLDFLQSQEVGARVVLMGVDQGKFAKYNDTLKDMAQKAGVDFAGALPTNNVHPGPNGYASYASGGTSLLNGSKALTVPAEPREALAFLQKALPADKGIVLFPNSPVDPTAFWVGYRPRLTGVAPPAPTDAQMQSQRERLQQTNTQGAEGMQQMKNDER